MTTYAAPMGHPTVERLAALFQACGTTRTEAAFGALPANRVPQRLTQADELAERERLNQRDRRPSVAPLASYRITEMGSERHKQFGICFEFADGTTQVFAPHTN